MALLRRIKNLLPDTKEGVRKSKSSVSFHPADNRRGKTGLPKRIARQWGLAPRNVHWLMVQIDILSLKRMIWLLPDKDEYFTKKPYFRPSFRQILRLLTNKAHAWRVVCPLLEAIPRSPRRSEEEYRPAILNYLEGVREGREIEGTIYDPSFLRAQFHHWNLVENRTQPLLCQFASLHLPFSNLISPHPLFDTAYYNSQRNEEKTFMESREKIPVIMEYLMGCVRNKRFRTLEPTSQFNPTLWQIIRSDYESTVDEDGLKLNQSPLAEFLESMNSSTTSCPIGHQKLSGVVDGLESDGVIKGWCKPIMSGRPAELAVCIDGVVLGTGIADLPRPDIARRGVEASNCGFAIYLDLELIPTTKLKDIVGTRWQVITSDHKATLGRGDWRLNDTDKLLLCKELTQRCLSEGDVESLRESLIKIKDQQVLENICHHITRWCAIQAAAGSWDCSPVLLLQELTSRNSLLIRGVEAESNQRSQLILLALQEISTYYSVADDGITSLPETIRSVANLVGSLNERCYYGMTQKERSLWEELLKPLVNTVLADLLLNDTRVPLPMEINSLLRTMARMTEEVHGDLVLARTIYSIVNPSSLEDDRRFMSLKLKSGNAMDVAISIFHHRLHQKEVLLDPFDQAIALLEIGKISLNTIDKALDQLLELIPQKQAESPRISFCRKYLDQLGWHVNALCSSLIDKAIDYGMPRKLGLEIREASIRILSRISKGIWVGDGGKSGCTPLTRNKLAPLRWLLIGDKSLPQCWLYRVEQKRRQLESCGAEVRVIDQSELADWGFTQKLAWADTVIFCRTPAVYDTIRAFSFAKHIGINIFYDIDDLVFTSDYPAEYETYGGRISRRLHRHLALDYPFAYWSLANSDLVIASTDAIAEKCRQVLGAADAKDIIVLPNLPMSELTSLAARREINVSQKSSRIVVSSGTFSHKHIWNSELAPAIAEVLTRHAEVRLTVIGHLELPHCLQNFSQRITHIAYTDYSHYLKHISEATIALVALESHPTTDCKSAIKWMEASFLGVATVCSPVRAYTDVATTDEHILIARNKDEWIQQTEKLLSDSVYRNTIAMNALNHARATYSEDLGINLWKDKFFKIKTEVCSHGKQLEKKILFINVFFAPQSIGGATRVVQDHVRKTLEDSSINAEVTVLCIDHDPWQDFDTNNIPIDVDTNNIAIDVWNWQGARVVRLSARQRSWADIQDKDIEEFCFEWFQSESFDEIHCHCCQVLTASPLVAAKRLGVPYTITIHDAWWLSPELFLVSPAGRQINPSKPFDHIDGEPTAEEKSISLERRNILARILRDATTRFAVSNQFARIYEAAGVDDVAVKTNSYTSMKILETKKLRGEEDDLRLCHIGGMAMHKGYHILRESIHMLPEDVRFSITIVDHSLNHQSDSYKSQWNGFNVLFIPPVNMSEMARFYATQDLLVAPSIWPESFGLVTREALSAGLIVIASKIGALAEPITDGVNGFAVEPNNPTALRDALIKSRQCYNRMHSLPIVGN